MDLCEKNAISGDRRDCIIAALILHDSCKAGTKDKPDHRFFTKHADLPRKYFSGFTPECEEIPPQSEEIFDLIECHMGEWSRPEKVPTTMDQKIVHYADYLSSRREQPITDYLVVLEKLTTYDEEIIL